MHRSECHFEAGHALRGIFLAAMVLLCLGSTGCVRRRMTIRSYPPGAQVFVDDQEIGTTPCSSAFVYYGTRKIMLVKEGYKTETLYHQFTVPWYQYVPLDFINENLNPREIRDERIVDVTLAPEENVTQEQLIARANSLRGGARMGLVTPLPDPKAAEAIPNIGLPGEGLPGGQPIPYQSLPTPGIPGAGGAGTGFNPTAPLGPPASTMTPQGLLPPGATFPSQPGNPTGNPALGPQSLSPQGLLPSGSAPSGVLPAGPSSNFGQAPFGPPPLPPAGSQPPSGAVPPPGSPGQFFPSRAFQ
jgi:hypothetical protein